MLYSLIRSSKQNIINIYFSYGEQIIKFFFPWKDAVTFGNGLLLRRRFWRQQLLLSSNPLPKMTASLLLIIHRHYFHDHVSQGNENKTGGAIYLLVSQRFLCSNPFPNVMASLLLIICRHCFHDHVLQGNENKTLGATYSFVSIINWVATKTPQSQRNHQNFTISEQNIFSRI